MTSTFLNVDLEIRSSEQPALIEKELEERRVLNLFSGEIEDGHLSTFEVNLKKEEENTPDHLISEFCKIIEQFGDEAKKEWNDASDRVFDIGYESPKSEKHTLEQLKEETRIAIEGLGARINFTTHKQHDANQS